jgi:hypothetical protein
MNLKPFVKQPTSTTTRFKSKVVKIFVASKKYKKVRCAGLNIDFQWKIWFTVRIVELPDWLCNSSRIINSIPSAHNL